MCSQTVTVKYDSIQDRIAVVVRLPDSAFILHLTRRFTFGLLAALSRQVQKSQGDARLAKAGLQDELLSMKHARAVMQVRNAQVDAPRAPPVPDELPVRLPTRVDASYAPEGMASMVFFTDDAEVGRLIFRTRELHWFMERLVAHARQAGWADAIPVPEWLAQGKAEVAASSTSPALVVH